MGFLETLVDAGSTIVQGVGSAAVDLTTDIIVGQVQEHLGKKPGKKPGRREMRRMAAAGQVSGAALVPEVVGTSLEVLAEDPAGAVLAATGTMLPAGLSGVPTMVSSFFGADEDTSILPTVQQTRELAPAASLGNGLVVKGGKVCRLEPANTTGFRCRRVVPRAIGGQLFWMPAPRRINPLNIRAARRAMRRLVGLERIVKGVIGFRKRTTFKGIRKRKRK